MVLHIAILETVQCRQPLRILDSENVDIHLLADCAIVVPQFLAVAPGDDAQLPPDGFLLLNAELVVEDEGEGDAATHEHADRELYLAYPFDCVDSVHRNEDVVLQELAGDCLEAGQVYQEQLELV